MPVNDIDKLGMASQSQITANKNSTATANKEDTFTAIFDEIKEKGLLEYAEEKRIEEMREKILKEWGLSEDDLLEMSPEHRAKLEQRLNEEIMKRLAAEDELKHDFQRKIISKPDQINSVVSLENMGLKNAYFAVEKIMEQHMMELSSTKETLEEENNKEPNGLAM